MFFAAVHNLGTRQRRVAKEENGKKLVYSETGH